MYNFFFASCNFFCMINEQSNVMIMIFHTKKVSLMINDLLSSTSGERFLAVNTHKAIRMPSLLQRRDTSLRK